MEMMNLLVFSVLLVKWGIFAVPSLWVVMRLANGLGRAQCWADVTTVTTMTVAGEKRRLQRGSSPNPQNL